MFKYINLSCLCLTEKKSDKYWSFFFGVCVLNVNHLQLGEMWVLNVGARKELRNSLGPGQRVVSCLGELVTKSYEYGLGWKGP